VHDAAFGKGVDMSAQPPAAGVASRLVRFVGDRIGAGGPGEGRRLCILNYHRILEAPDPLLEAEPDAATFRWQMQVLADCFNVLPVHEALAALADGSMPPRAVCITFDDGYRSTHDLALPILREFGFPATVFVTTGHIDNGSMWNDRILEALRTIKTDRLDLSEAGVGNFALNTVAKRKYALSVLTEMAKYMAPMARQSLVELIEERAGSARRELMLTRDMVRVLSEHNVEIGAHTISHPILTRLDDATARHEITESKRQLEEIVCKPVRYFAYPNGKQDKDFDERHIRMAREAGFDAAFSTAIGAASREHERFALPRSRPWDTTRIFYVFRVLRWLAG